MMMLDQYLDRILSVIANHWIVAEIESQEIKYPAIEKLYIRLKLAIIDGSPVHIREFVVLTASAIERRGLFLSISL